MGLVTEKLYLHDAQISVDAYEDYSCFGEVSFFIMSKVSKWKIEQRLSFV
jgi:hypothetical protein